MPRPVKIVLLAAALVFIAGGVYPVHWLLGRPDRIAAAKARDDMYRVRDQVLRYESETGSLPVSLRDLVPLRLRLDQIEKDGSDLYRYDAWKRLLAQREGSRVKGIWSYRMHPAKASLPPLSEYAHHPPPPAGPATPPETPVSPAATDVPPETVPEPVAVPDPEPEPADVAEAPPATRARKDLLASGSLLVPADPGLSAPPDGAFVFEAELLNEMNYGWEVFPDKEAAGGAYLHCKEGIANGPGQRNYRIGNFYDVRTTSDYTYVKYHLHLPETGSYYCYGRFWTTDTHCSNHLCIDFDSGGPYTGGMDNRTPFRWVWSPIEGNPRHLTKGDHYMHIFIHEDGVRVDQFILSPTPVSGSMPYKANLVPGQGTEWRKKVESPVHLSFDLKSMVVTTAMPPVCSVVMRRVGDSNDTARFTVTLNEAAPNGADVQLADYDVRLSDLPELSLFPIDFEPLDMHDLPRREYLLTAVLAVGDAEVARAAVPLMKPYDWQVFGPGRFILNGQPGPLDADGEPRPEHKGAWTPFKDSSWDHFGVLDFGLQTSGNSLHAPTYRTIYARTIINSQKAGTYLFKVQGDDQTIVWLDGKQVFRHDFQRPVTRASFKFTQYLDQGVHRLRMRVNQYEGRWQASIRIRTEEDDVCSVAGVELEAPPAEEKKKEQ
ncbi:MAG: hypothetical protein JW909_09650 [Planctomycetes bacterium]|nr:hypothetical protein [Planctomycetota bacterium]